MGENKEETLNQILLLEEEKLKIKNAIKSSGDILIFIGFLTLVNVPALAYFEIIFPIGLFSPFLFIQKIAPFFTDNYYYWLTFIVLNLFIWVFFTFLSNNANKNSKIAFYIAFIIYSLDTILSATYQEWFITFFHLIFLYQIFSGYSKIDNLLKLEKDISKIRNITTE
ncbi:hypothetical protein [Leptospira brenneri]|uniref:hypothetical protein n=1 Tax=Leptospira brenneri TaxID=2023182 RepID=UPI000C2A71F9|nr:hypothetical protein [Leptospira brenneri]PJZ43656.1 hypothetical protein CH361_19330 [Leptospira brenneri]